MVDLTTSNQKEHTTKADKKYQRPTKSVRLKSNLQVNAEKPDLRLDVNNKKIHQLESDSTLHRVLKQVSFHLNGTQFQSARAD